MLQEPSSGSEPVAEHEFTEPDLGEDMALPSVLHELSEVYSFPSAQHLWATLHRKGIRVTKRQVDDFMLEHQGFRRQFQPPFIPDNSGNKLKSRDHPVKAGVYNMGRPRTRWFADLIKFAQVDASEGYQYALLVLDGFSRRLFARVLSSSQATGVAAALEDILTEAGEPPVEIVSDQGRDFRNRVVDDFLRSRGIAHVYRDVKDYAVTSQLDAAIRGFKRAIALRKAADPTFQWSQHVQDLVFAANSIPRDHLLGATSLEIDRSGTAEATKEDDNAAFSLEKQAAKRIQLNEANVERRATKLQKVGRFNTRIDGGAFRRGHHATWGPDRRVAHVYGNVLVDTQGDTHQARLVRPVGRAR